MTPEPPADTVVLVHGLARSAGNTYLRMRPRLEAEGFRTVPFDYASLRNDLATCGQELRAVLDELQDDDEVGAVHIVTHSMGGPVTRSALGKEAPAKVRRVVMMAPPNSGSGVAAALEGTLGKWIPAIGELSSRPDSAINQLPIPPGVEVGVIAATWDHVVSSTSTQLPGQADHITLRGMHSSITYQENATDQVLHFLRHGRFAHDSTGPAPRLED